MLRGFCSGLVPGVLLCVGTAHAQPVEGTAQAEPRARLELDGGAGVQFRVKQLRSEQTVGVCRQPCAVSLPYGRYKVYVFDAQTGDDFELKLRVEGSRRYVLRRGDDTTRYAGLTMGIAGPLLFLGGIYVTLFALDPGVCRSTDCRDVPTDRTLATVGVTMMVTGVIATPVGWVLFGTNRTKLVPADEARREAKPRLASLRLGVTPVATGAFGVGVVGRF